MKTFALFCATLALCLTVAVAHCESLTLVCKCDNNRLLVFNNGNCFKVFPGEMKNPANWTPFTNCTVTSRGVNNGEFGSYQIINQRTKDSLVADRLK